MERTKRIFAIYYAGKRIDTMHDCETPEQAIEAAKRTELFAAKEITGKARLRHED